jgi:segregation and condensation protein A
VSFEIKLPLFQGPFDLLLFFIERDELDIHDIPISKITNDFLQYLKHLEKMEMDVASEFILVAATLMRIKAKLLIPRPQLDEQGQEIDPRDELVAHLLEYKKYKSVIAELSQWEEERASKERRGNVIKEIRKLSEANNVEYELQNLDLFRLLKVYQKVLNRFSEEQNKPKHFVEQYPYTIEQQKEYILTRVSGKSKVSFEEIIMDNTEKIAVVYNFLSILELLQLNKIKIHLGQGYNNFWIAEADDEEETVMQHEGVNI